MSDLVRLTIDGREVEVPQGTNLLEAAKLAGVFVPHYCYHPSLPVAGVCRMCLVDIQGIPKVQPACNSFAKEGMVVQTNVWPARSTKVSSPVPVISWQNRMHRVHWMQRVMSATTWGPISVRS